MRGRELECQTQRFDLETQKQPEFTTDSDRVSRVHRAPGDSGQNEAERSNAAIGDALVDGSALKWNYYATLDGLSQYEIENLSLIDLQKREEDCMEKNAWRVAKEVAQTIDDEPGPAGDYIKSYVTTQKERQFFLTPNTCSNMPLPSQM